MSILIKDMDMPKNCYDCELRMDNGNSCGCVVTGYDMWDIDDRTEIHPDCPLVEVEEYTAFSNFDDKERKVYVSID